MAKQNKSTLKNYFQTGDRPSQAQYADLIDSQLNLAETGTQILDGILSSSGLGVTGDITASGHISASSGRVSTPNLTVSSLGSMQVPFIEAGSGGDFGGSGLFTFLAGVLTVPEIANVNTTHVTASGNISASNKVLGLTGSFGRLEATTSSFGTFESTLISSSNVISNHITASGNISASGTIEARTGSFGYLESDNVMGHTSDPGTEIRFSSDTITLNANTIENFRAGGNFTRVGNTTKPTHISGSVVGIPLATLPTSDPNVAGRLWRDGTDLKISLG